MITATTLRSRTSKDLAQMAKAKGVSGWHSMRKEELIQALVKQSKRKPKAAKKTAARKTIAPKTLARSSNGTSKAPRSKTTESKIARKIRRERLRKESLKNLALINSLEQTQAEPTQDRLIVVVRDPYWVQAYWEITKTTVARAKVALCDHWHTARPVLRLLELSSDKSTNSTENIVREIPIHGGVRNWFIDVPDPPKTYRIAIGYTTDDGKFHLIAKSNAVTTPVPSEAFDNNWADISGDFRKFYALSGGYSKNTTNELQSVFEEKLRRPMNQPEFVRLGTGVNNDCVSFDFEVDAHLVIQGEADPNANVTLAGEPVRLESDGRFCVKLNLPDKRQVLPIVSTSRDGTQQRTTVLAIERNTKIMDPVTKDLNEL